MFKLNSQLIAKDPCIIEDSGEPSLTVGKEYKIIRLSPSGDPKTSKFAVESDDGELHWFGFDFALEIFDRV